MKAEVATAGSLVGQDADGSLGDDQDQVHAETDSADA
jgi:hypothetical protein